MNSLENFRIEAQDFLNHTLLHLQKIDFNKNLYEAIHKIASCSGVVITTGMGKNGHIAKKVSSTLSSLKIPSCSIHPGEALHGDSGIIRDCDILMVFSTSGKTEEIIKTIEISRVLGIKCVISLTSHVDSPIKKMSDIVIDIGEIEEAGYLGLAPTTSTLVMLFIGDVIATFAAQEKGVTKQEFNDRHHSGYLGFKSKSYQ